MHLKSLINNNVRMLQSHAHSQGFLEAPVGLGLVLLQLLLHTQPERHRLVITAGIRSEKQSFNMFSNVSTSHAPVQEDRCCQVLQVVLGDQRGLLAQQDPVLLSVHHGPGKHMQLHNWDSLSTQGYFLLRYSRGWTIKSKQVATATPPLAF